MTDTSAGDGRQDQGGAVAPTVPDGADTEPGRLRSRRLAAWHGCTRVLNRPASAGTTGDQLRRLAELAPDAYDLDTWVDMYGDGIVEELEQRVGALLGTEAAAFFPTGTMAQQVALRCWAGRTGNPAVALHPLGHPVLWERDALSVVSGLRTVRPTTEPRPPTAEELRALDEPAGTLMLELPLRDAGFVLPSWEELTDVVAAARERDMVVHFDGARLWECAPHFGRELREIAGLADSVYGSFYKSLGGASGAALAGPESFVAEAKAWRHRYGGLLFQQWPAALAALIGLDNELPRLPAYVAHAATVARALRESLAASRVPWFRVHPEEPHTHQFQVWLPYPADVLNEAAVRQAEQTRTALFRMFTEPGLPPGLSRTEVTVGAAGLDWDASDVAEALTGFLDVLDAVRSEA